MLIQQSILHFLETLKDNNNREWFAENKEWYKATLQSFEKITEQILAEIVKFDEELKNLTAKDCIFRIYRDTRFSHNKTPYKTHFGAYLAAPGGRKSLRAGYYIHLEPNNSFIGLGIYSPPPALLKELRQSVYDNIDELNEIRKGTNFSSYFNEFYDEDKLKNIPRGFPKDFQEAELLKLKHYLLNYMLDKKILLSEDFASQIAQICKIAYPFNLFFNYTVDEWLHKEHLT